nr:unnamed protein product [Digitaria exilis]
MQSRAIQLVLHVLKETLDTIDLPSLPENKLLTVADLGCSCGQNALDVADAIVQHVAEQCDARGQAAPEFCFYFSDLPSNDFNTLFHRLHDNYSTAKTSENGSQRRRRRPYFAAGVPGSFYGRLFPERSIDAFTSTFSLHWLSQVHREVVDERSPAYNRRNVFVHGAPEEPGVAYRRQFQLDLARFLSSRAAELRLGGAMFLVCIGRPSSASPTDQGNLGQHQQMLQDSWDDIVGEGLMDAEKTTRFNVPMYAPTLEEFREAVKADGSFRINRLEMVTGSSLVGDRPGDPSAVGRVVTNMVRSVFGVLIDAHIGSVLGGEVFRRLERRVADRAEEMVQGLRLPNVVCSLSLA